MANLPTPLGPVTAGAVDAGICMLQFGTDQSDKPAVALSGRRQSAATGCSDHPHLRELERQLRDYFAGIRQQFDLPLYMPGTEFQQQAWRALLRIPYGSTCSYRDQARLAGRPGAFRAIAQANAGNRIAIIIPCHRVINADGRLGGYAAGVRRKRYLLDLEQRFAASRTI